MSIEVRKSQDPLPQDRIPVPVKAARRVTRDEIPEEVIFAIRESKQHERDNESHRRF